MNRANTVNQLFEYNTNKFQNKIALTFNGNSITYTQLNEKANQLANYLLANHHIKPNDIIGILSEPSDKIILSILGILKAGAAYLPLSSLFPNERIEYMVTDCDTKILFVDRKLIQKIATKNCKIIFLDEIEKLIDGFSAENTNPQTTGEDIAYIMYTSGTTGKPNGVEIPHRGITRLVSGATYLPFDEDLTFLQLSTISFDASTFEIWGALLNGHKLVMYPDRVVEFDRLKQVVDQLKINCLFLTTSLFNVLIDEDPLALRTIKYILTGGETISVKHIRKAQELLPVTQLIHVYGPTECTTFAMSYPIAKLTSDENVIPIGKAIDETTIYLFDENFKQPAIGEIGELYLRGNGLAIGYRNNIKLTEERFIKHSFSENKHIRLYKTGDLCRMKADGNLEFIGRRDHQLKIRGFRVEIGEIENAIKRHSAINQCLVITKQSDISIELIAYIVGTNHIQDKIDTEICATIDTNSLKTNLKLWLPEYMIPTHIIELNRFPLNQNGKIDREKLPIPMNEKTIIQQTTALTSTEEKLIDLWKELLGIKHIGIEEYFYEIGGNSLQTVRMIYKVNNLFATSIRLGQFYKNQTIKQLSKMIENSTEKKKLQLSNYKIKRDSLIPLSPAQERMWVFDEFNKNLTVYNIPFRFDMRGELNISYLETAINVMIQRQESFRTSFITEHGIPMQRINPFKPISLQIEDLPNCTEEELERILRKEGQIPFNLEEQNLIRCKILRISESYHILNGTFHHIIYDGWSVTIFKKEIETVYNALIAGESYSTIPHPIQYVEYAAWQRELSNSDYYQKHFEYWEQKLGHNPQATELRPDFPRPKAQTFEGNMQEIWLSSEQLVDIKKYCRQKRVTLFLFLISCLKTTLFRYTHQSKITIGSPNANRSSLETQNMIGFFVNNMVLSSDISAEMSFEELLNQMRTTFHDAVDFQDVPFEKLVEKLIDHRDASRSPLFQILFILQNIDSNQMNLTGIKTIQHTIDNNTSKYDFTLIAEEYDGEFSIQMEYNTDLYQPETIDHFLNNFKTLILDALCSTDKKIGELELIHPVEKKALLSHESTPFSETKTIHQLFEEQVEKTPDATAVIFENQTFSYSEINQRANQLAHFLRENGYGESDKLVGVMMERSENLLIALLGILKSGSAYIPLDFNYPTDRIDFMIEDCKTEIVLCDDATAQLLAKTTAQFRAINILNDIPTNSKTRNPENNSNPNDLAYCIYTSGSTGKPKAVMLEHRSVVNLIEGVYTQTNLHQTKNILCLTTFCFDIFVVESWIPLTQGLTVIMASEEDNIEPDNVCSLITTHNIECIQATPSRLEWLLLSQSSENALKEVVSILVGGEPLPAKLVERLNAIVKASIFNMYGPTETTVWSSLKEIKDNIINIGKPIQNNQLFILDANKRLCPTGVVGEIAIGGDSLARGYLHNETIANEKFIPNPFNPTQKIYLTGDLGIRLNNGDFECLGRMDFQVKIRGHRIELGEIENAILRLKEVKECLVSTYKINNQNELVAYIVSDKNVDIKHIKNHLRNLVPNYMIPIHFTILDSFPLNPNGKIDRKRLPAPHISASEKVYKTTELNETESKLRKIWQQILGIESISKSDNFFELGGYSLLAIKLIHEINVTFKTSFAPKDIFTNTTIESFAHLIDSKMHNDKLPEGIVKIKDGNDENIFMAPGNGGNAFSFQNFAQKYNGNQSIYCLEYPKDEDGNFPLKTLQELATYFVDRIMSIQPVGLFNILGYSFGGRLAFEIVIQLQQKGKEINLLGIIDGFGISKLLKIETNFRNMIKDAYFLLALESSDKWKYLKMRLTEIKKRRFTKRPTIKSSNEIIDEIRFKFYSKEHQIKMAEIQEKYINGTKFIGDITLFKENDEMFFKTSKRLYFLSKIAPDLFWANMITGHIKAIKINCEHVQFLASENIIEVVRKIEEHFNKTE
ncbi:MAG: amino acid adenylation domain-containing protein [Bacteroidales bacterium]|nr:amino acid adenylation domain-containing protein [Bacteroidales bacterium]